MSYHIVSQFCYEKSYCYFFTSFLSFSFFTVSPFSLYSQPQPHTLFSILTNTTILTILSHLQFLITTPLCQILQSQILMFWLLFLEVRRQLQKHPLQLKTLLLNFLVLLCKIHLSLKLHFIHIQLHLLL